MNRYSLSLLALGATQVSCERTQNEERPNVLIILTDQLNASVLGCYGGDVLTPNIDKLASKGALFTNMMCSTPYSSPSRASIVTGMYPHKHGISHNCMKVDYPAISSSDTEEGITNMDVTTDRIMNENGYRTHHYGKWHLTQERLDYFPDMYGEHHEYADEMKVKFDSLSQSESCVMNWYGWQLPIERCQHIEDNEKQILRRWADAGHVAYTHFAINIGKSLLPLEDDFDYRVTAKTMESIERKADSPFMITCSFNQPHDPNVINEPYYSMIDPANIKLPKSVNNIDLRYNNSWSRVVVSGSNETFLREFMRIYYANVMKVDDQVGRIMDALEKSGKLDNTIVIFTADHGDMCGEHGMIWKSTDAFYQGVVRIPFIVSWPSKVMYNTYDLPSEIVDIMPTILEAVGYEIPKQNQGESLLPLILGEKPASEYSQYAFCERLRANYGSVRTMRSDWEQSGAFMIVSKEYKYFVYGGVDDYFYDLVNDPYEMTNQIDNPKYADTINVMKSELAKWVEDTK